MVPTDSKNSAQFNLNLAVLVIYTWQNRIRDLHSNGCVANFDILRLTNTVSSINYISYPDPDRLTVKRYVNRTVSSEISNFTGKSIRVRFVGRPACHC